MILILSQKKSTNMIKTPKLISEIIKFAYVTNPADKLFFSAGAAISGFFFIAIGQIFYGNFNSNHLILLIYAWIWLRFISSFPNNNTIKNSKQSFIFAITWLAPVIFLCVCGIFQIKIFNEAVYTLGAIDFGYVLLVSFKNRNHAQRTAKNLLFGFGLGICMCIAITNSHYPWLEKSALAGLGYVDDYRDAAVVMSWANYKSLSHGVHGLLFEPYHSLGALFFSPFIDNEHNVFEVFTSFSFIFTPALVIYGCISVIELISHPAIKKIKYYVVILFIFTFSGVEYVANQRSFQISTLLLIGILPLLHNACTSGKAFDSNVFLLSFLTPLLFFARIFQGFSLAATFYSAFIYKEFRVKAILLGSAMISALFIIYFYGHTGRTKIKLLNYEVYYLYFERQSWFLNVWLMWAVVIGVVLILLDNKTSYFKLKTCDGTRIGFSTIIGSISSIALAMFLPISSDAFYQLAPSFWIAFFLLSSASFIELTAASFKKRMIFLPGSERIAIGSIILIVSYSYMANVIPSFLNSTKTEIRITRELTSQWNPEGNNPVLLHRRAFLIDCPTKDYSTVCNLRARIFGSANLDNLILHSLPAKLAAQAKLVSSDMTGISAVYVPPNHPYWQIKFERDSIPSMYFMASIGLPMIFGAHPRDINPAYSIQTAHNFGGTLRSIDWQNDQISICSLAKTIGVRNVIAFTLEPDRVDTLRCSSDGLVVDFESKKL